MSFFKSEANQTTVKGKKCDGQVRNNTLVITCIKAKKECIYFIRIGFKSYLVSHYSQNPSKHQIWIRVKYFEI